MRKIWIFSVLIFLLFLTHCTGVRGMLYDPPILAENYFENVQFKLYIYSWEDFQKIIMFYYGQPQPGTTGITIMRPAGERIVVIPRKEDGTIDLETLGHEIFYHVINNCGDSHKIPPRKE